MFSSQTFTQFYSQFFSIDHSIKKIETDKRVLILAPHPDDECLMGAFALRLRLENNAKVFAISVTLGSKIERQNERREEFKNACLHLGFTPLYLSEEWSIKERELEQMIRDNNINVIISPHNEDFHPAHIKTNFLAREVMQKMQFNGHFIESEFWGEMKSPNLLLEITHECFSLMFEGLTLHEGEVSRNPYHLRLAASLVDNVRKGAEKVSPLGSASPQFAFGSLYRFHKVSGGQLKTINPTILSYKDDLSLTF